MRSARLYSRQLRILRGSGHLLPISSAVEHRRLRGRSAAERGRRPREAEARTASRPGKAGSTRSGWEVGETGIFFNSPPPVHRHPEHSPHLDRVRDKTGPPARGPNALRHPSWHRSDRPFHPRAALPEAVPPFRPGSARHGPLLPGNEWAVRPTPCAPIVPPSPCRNPAAGRTLGSLLRYFGGDRRAHGGPEDRGAGR